MEKKKVEILANSKQVSVNASPTLVEKKKFEEKPITREHKSFTIFFLQKHFFLGWWLLINIP